MSKAFPVTRIPPIAREHLTGVISAGIMSGFFEVIYAISLVSIIFSGKMSDRLADGIGLALITVTLAPVITGLLSRTPGIIGNIHGSHLIILNVAIASFVGSSTASSDDLFPTVVLMIVSSSLLTGITFYAIGFFRLTRFVQYIPYPVVGGFLAGTGWLLIQGAVGTMAGIPVTWQNLAELLALTTRWLPGVVIALVIFIGLERIKHALALPGLLLLCLAGFFAVLLLTGTPIDTSTGNGLLLGDFGGEIRWQPLSIGLLLDADLHAMLPHLGTVLTSVAISTVTILLYLSGIDTSLRRDIDVNAELQVNGITNLAVGFLGGSVTMPSVPLTVLSNRLNASYHQTGVIIGAFGLLTFFFGAPLIAYVPFAVLGGLLIFMGLLFVRDWIILGYKRLSRADYGIVWLIAIVIGIFGFLQGVAIGLVVTIFVFVFKYSRTSILYRRRSGMAIKSNMERSLHHARELRKLMGSVHVIELQGFLFFGTATTLLEAIHERVKDPEEPALEYIVVDFRRVQGIDASALMNFTKAAELAHQNNFTLVLTGITAQLEQQLALMLEHDAVVVEPSLDYGIEYCEKMLLDAVMVTQPSIISTLPLQLQEMGMSKAVAARLIPYLETKKVAAGETLISQGDESTDLYFVQIGQVSVILEADHGTRIRLHTMTMGTVVGELGFYLQTQRSASVIVDVFSIVHRLSTDSIDRMKSEDPQLAIELHEMLTRIIAARLVNTNQAMIAMN